MALALLEEEEEYDTLFEYIAALWLNCVFTQCSYQAGAFLDISRKKKKIEMEHYKPSECALDGTQVQIRCCTSKRDLQKLVSNFD